VPRITDFCSFMYIFGCKLSLDRLCDSDFGITPVGDIIIGITCAALLLLLLLNFDNCINNISMVKNEKITGWRPRSFLTLNK